MQDNFFHNVKISRMKFILAALLSVSLLCGCATKWQDATGKSLATIAQTVDLAMRGWETYSVRAGLADDSPEELRVRAALRQYQLAFDSSLQAYNAAVKLGSESIWNQSAAALTASQTSLLNLIAELEK